MLLARLMTIALPTLPKADADESAAAVPDHNRDGEGYDGQRKDNGVGRVAVGAEVGSVGDEDLVDDVVQRTDQKRNDAGNGVLLHQFADRLGAQKLIGMVHWLFSLLKNAEQPCASALPLLCPFDRAACGI